jgi:hypothetical protein
MSTETYTRKILSGKGWVIKSFEYEKPKSGFKCIEGGYFCELVSDENDYDILENIPFDNNVFGSISGSGLIMALYKKDFIQLINKIPNKPLPS